MEEVAEEALIEAAVAVVVVVAVVDVEASAEVVTMLGRPRD